MTRLLLLSAGLLLLTSTAHAQLPRLLPPAPGNPSCVPLARTLNSGACAPVAAALRPVMGSLATATCDALAAHPAQATITPACCADVKAFIAGGCACDAGVNTLLSAAGVPAGALAGGVRLAQASICGQAANGGPLTTPTCKDIAACAAKA